MSVKISIANKGGYSQRYFCKPQAFNRVEAESSVTPHGTRGPLDGSVVAQAGVMRWQLLENCRFITSLPNQRTLLASPRLHIVNEIPEALILSRGQGFKVPSVSGTSAKQGRSFLVMMTEPVWERSLYNG
jgi:hypothetical protein